MFQYGGSGFAGLVQAVKVGDSEGGCLGAGHEVYLGFSNDAEGSLGADDHLAEVHIAAVQEPVQVIAADPPHDARVAVFYLLAVFLGDFKDAAVDAGFQPVAAQLALQFRRAEVGESGLCAVGKDYLKLQDVVAGLAVDDGMGAAGVVADAAAHRGAVRRRGVWSVFQAVGRQ